MLGLHLELADQGHVVLLQLPLGEHSLVLSPSNGKHHEHWNDVSKLVEQPRHSSHTGEHLAEDWQESVLLDHLKGGEDYDEQQLQHLQHTH